MQVMVNIPDNLYHDIEKIGTNVESSIIQALEYYAERKKMLENDPLYKWANTPVPDKEGKTDGSVNHDKYIYTL